MRSAGLVCRHCHTALSSFRTAAVGLAFAGLEAVRSPPSMDLRITGGGAGRDLHTIPATTFQTTNSAAGFGPSFNPQNGDGPQSMGALLLLSPAQLLLYGASFYRHLSCLRSVHHAIWPDPSPTAQHKSWNQSSDSSSCRRQGARH